MSISTRQLAWFGAGLCWASLLSLPATADDTELFVGSSTILQGQPNILFILDDSGSMGDNITTREPYDPSIDYGGCDPTKTFYKSGNDADNPPSCSSDNWLDTSAIHCDAAQAAFAGPGFYADTIAQFDALYDVRWEAIVQSGKSRPVECQADSGAHGDGSDPSLVYAQSGDAANPWSANIGDEIAWDSEEDYVLYSANYVDWWHNGPTTTQSKLEIMKQVSTDLLDAINGVNVGLMNFNGEHGGQVIHEVADIATARATMKTAINNLTDGGYTPLSETFHEAALYLMGRPVDLGGAGVLSAREPLDPTTYDSPLELSCQRNFVVMLTDGEPTRDDDRDAEIMALQDEASQSFGTLVGGACDAETYPAHLDPSGGECLDDLAEFLYEGDLSTEPGQQNVSTYTVGFDIDLPVLADTAARGGGEYRTANDAASLTAVLTDFVLNILDTQSTFSAPAVSINSFNRTRNLNDLFISVFGPTTRTHWPGNLKKYRLRASDSTIVDADGDPAVDPATGFFAAGSRSFWSPTDDPNVAQGGAANRLPAPVSRNVYTHLTGNPNALTAASNSVETGNFAIDDALLNTGAPGQPTRAEVIDFIRGFEPGSTTVTRNQMGDPLHSQPVTMIYDGSDPNAALVFFATNDGYLHAINPNTGVEQWAFLPEEFLGDQVDLYIDEATTNKHYGIDGNLRLQTLMDNDGVIDPATEKVYLIFGMRRGGTFYYALDVTEPTAPQLVWRRGSAELGGNGQSWSNPVPARIEVNSANQTDTTEHLVLVLGGGYDTTQDGYDNVVDTNGNALYIVETTTGNVLWHGSRTAGDKQFADMASSFPSDIKVVDLDGDQLADRMYAADTGGQVWRFDIHNGNTPAGLVTGGVIAQLGAAPLPDSPPVPIADGADNRRFYYAPDVALVSQPGQTYVHIGIGTGYRAHPLSTVNHDRFYALRDYNAFGKLNDAQYAAITPIVDADLVDVTDDVNTTVTPGSDGWRIELRDPTWRGEKVLAEARTFNNQIYFTTFIPDAGASADPCVPAPALNRLWVVSLFDGSPVTNLDGDATPDEEEDRYIEFPGTITSEVVFVFPSPDDPDNCVGDECSPEPVACVDLFCLNTNFGNNPVRTFWSQESVD